MVHGRGSAFAAGATVLLIVTWVRLCEHTAWAATYTVGGSKGWDVGVDYTAWQAGLTFKVGDVLLFPYVVGAHNVVVVDKAGYDTCSGDKAVTTYSDGNTRVTLSSTGAHYYLCSVIGHCDYGMKLAITVSAAAAAAPPPATPPPSSPPASAPAPVSPPPSKAPSPSPSPSSSLAPAPSSPAPTPSSPAPAPFSSPTPAPAPAETPTAPAPSSTPAGTPTTLPGSSLPAGGTPPSSPPNAAHSLLLSAGFASYLGIAAGFLVL